VAYIQANHLSGREKNARQRVGGTPTNCRRRRAEWKKSAAAAWTECRRRGATGAERYQIS